ncbi:aldehyde dehydrogenase family protein [Actinophytocola xinjiangensis]|uniref:aldehyde dehydrogenase (NAD(+)) n=1 Tax=Actinophytocola xinjiangensis TaxID=485602 RepID=A0A7Z0WEZ2_9PSEU|nr:aldehyde dehydrogenase family protein [Actinophytocola xinjiangensis]OLF05755.1 aldehyde dehydrogenase family protein [Actinophytocola xinjiangensis]
MTRGHFLDGDWVPGTGALTVTDPSTGEPAGAVAAGDAAVVDRAVAAARAAFPGWAARPLDTRIALVRAIREGIARERDALARVLTAEMGAPITFARQAQVGVALADLDALIAAAEAGEPETQVSRSRVVAEPAGVVAAITPWNFPLHQIVLKLGAALLAGCTVVLKPSEVAPLNAVALADLLAGAGLPAGVVNVVFGTGPDVGEPLVAHPDVDLVSFTGSRAVGGRIGALAGAAIKRVSLELGGKSAAVMLPDTDLTTAAPQLVGACFANTGQTCAALTRLLVPAGTEDDWLDAVAGALAPWAPADPRLESTLLGPLASHPQRDRVRGHIQAALADGARLVLGGPETPAGLGSGAYLAPTVFTGVDPAMRLFREEVFGPVLAVTAYRTEDEAAALANDSDYGLSGGVWSADPERALAFARRIRTGTVGLNGAGLDVGAPFGGVKQSGVGRECGSHGIAEFQELKTIMGAPALPAR